FVTGLRYPVSASLSWPGLSRPSRLVGQWRCVPKRDHRDIGERSDAVLRTAMPGDDSRRLMREHRTRLGQFLRRVDAERHAFDQGDVDTHPGVERAQLLEPLALLVGGWRQFDETLQRRAPIGVKPYVMIVRARAGRIGTGERDRAKPVGRDRGAGNLDHVRIGALSR